MQEVEDFSYLGRRIYYSDRHLTYYISLLLDKFWDSILKYTFFKSLPTDHYYSFLNHATATKHNLAILVLFLSSLAGIAGLNPAWGMEVSLL
jgi:hypothetical protein